MRDYCFDMRSKCFPIEDAPSAEYASDRSTSSLVPASDRFHSTAMTDVNAWSPSANVHCGHKGHRRKR
jgi:hypothetical protein